MATDNKNFLKVVPDASPTAVADHQTDAGASRDAGGRHEVSWAELMTLTTAPGNRRERAGVRWTHPAVANGRIYLRRGEEINAASLGVHE